jgi:F420-dependent oxidoreductase-like protein
LRIGLTARGSTVDDLVEHARWAEDAGFSSVWYASPTAGDPLVAMALAGRATSSIELGTAVLQTYPCHPLLQAHRAASVVAAMGRPGFTLGVGPSHETRIRDVYGLSYSHPGRNTEEYVQILAGLMRGAPVDFDGRDWSVHSPTGVAVNHPVPILVAALSPRLLRVAGAVADGTVLYLVSARVIESRVAPQIQASAAATGRPPPRIVAGLPVAVHDDVSEARAVIARESGIYGSLPNYRRVIAEAGQNSVADVAIVGDERSVAAQLRSLTDAGATDVWAGILPVGDDKAASLRRTTDLLRELLGSDTPSPLREEGTW